MVFPKPAKKFRPNEEELQVAEALRTVIARPTENAWWKTREPHSGMRRFTRPAVTRLSAHESERREVEHHQHLSFDLQAASDVS